MWSKKIQLLQKIQFAFTVLVCVGCFRRSNFSGARIWNWSHIYHCQRNQSLLLFLVLTFRSALAVLQALEFEFEKFSNFCYWKVENRAETCNWCFLQMYFVKGRRRFFFWIFKKLNIFDNCIGYDYLIFSHILWVFWNQIINYMQKSYMCTMSFCIILLCSCNRSCSSWTTILKEHAEQISGFICNDHSV